MFVSRPFYERELSSALLYLPVRAMANEGGGGEKESGGGGPAVVIDEEPFGRSVDAPCRLGRRTRSLGERELLAWAHRLPTRPERESSRASLAHLFILLPSGERWRKLPGFLSALGEGELRGNAVLIVAARRAPRQVR